jgi:alcohol dehydrogenase
MTSSVAARSRSVETSFGMLRLPETISFGVGAIASIGQATAAFGRRAFVCADPFIASTEHYRQAAESMSAAGLTVETFTDVVPELPVDAVQAAGGAARGFVPDVVVGIGGGSALDLAKLVALLVAQDAPLSAFYGENRVPGPTVPVVAVPTTHGTGSEVTPVAVVSDPDRELKVGVSSPWLIPQRAIVDPALGVGAPPAVTAYAGIDALVHGVESFTASRRVPAWSEQLPVFVGRNRFSSLLALESIRVIGESLRAAVSQPDELSPRVAMAWGSLLAGMAFGTGGTHLSHALQYPVGAATKTPHGMGTGLLLPYVMQACLPETVCELDEIASALGCGGVAGTGGNAHSAISAVRSLAADIGIPRTLADIGVAREQLGRFAELALGVSRLAGNAALPPTRPLFDAILEAAYSGDRPGPAPVTGAAGTEKTVHTGQGDSRDVQG